LKLHPDGGLRKADVGPAVGPVDQESGVSALASPPPPSPPPRARTRRSGLRNLGYTCYANSVVPHTLCWPVHGTVPGRAIDCDACMGTGPAGALLLCGPPCHSARPQRLARARQ
jgi:hypothetical protein